MSKQILVSFIAILMLQLASGNLNSSFYLSALNPFEISISIPLTLAIAVPLLLSKYLLKLCLFIYLKQITYGVV